MYYVCIENNAISTILNYEPAVPASMSIVTITDAEEKSIRDQTHIFDILTNSVVPVASSVTAQKEQEKANGLEKEFLNSTDWKILRHLRQKALAATTSMTESEYLALEQQRQDAAARII